MNEGKVSEEKLVSYKLSRRDMRVMDAILDPMAADGRVKKVPLEKPSPVSCPAFVVWHNDKTRVVIDLRRVNTKLIPNAYPLLRQLTVASMGLSVSHNTS